MTAYPSWTPASRPGIIPLRPLTFGTILGRSFVALRQNPRVLLGFALCVQTAAYLLVLLGVGAVAVASFARLDTLLPGTDEFDAVMAGSIAVTAIAGVVLGLAAGALAVIVQGVVVTEVAHAAVAEKLTLGAVWRQVKPVIWRLVGYALLLAVAALLLIAVVAAVIIAIGFAALPVAVGLTVLAVLAAIPITLWLTTKLLLVPAAIILEHATIGAAIARSWTLIRGRFWPALGIIVVISLVFGTIAQVVSIPFSFLTTGLTTIIAPTGDPDPSAIIGVIVAVVLTQIVTLLIQSVAVVVQATATAIIYIDCRMRREGLDIDLLSYVERRDAGGVGLPDPYRENIGRVIAPRPTAYAPTAYPPPPGYPAPYQPGQAYAPQPGYGPPPGPAAQTGYAAQPGYAPQPGSAPQQGYMPQPGYAQGYPPEAPAAPVAPPPYAPTASPAPDSDQDPPARDDAPRRPAPDRWTAPGASAGAADPDSPWS